MGMHALFGAKVTDRDGGGVGNCTAGAILGFERTEAASPGIGGSARGDCRSGTPGGVGIGAT